MVHWEMMGEKKKRVYAALLFIPLLLSVSWLVYIKIGMSYGYAGLLSPIDNMPLITGLVIFTSGYIFFLGLMFSNNIREWYEDWNFERRHRNI